MLGEECIYQNYFVDVHVYNVKLFQCCYKMSCQLFLHVMDVYIQDPNFCRNMMLACGIAFDICDEYYKLGESMVMELFKRFIIVVEVVFKTHYLDKPT